MTKAELINIIVPATIEKWTVETPQYKHDGKERQLSRIFSQMRKQDLEGHLASLQEHGYAK